MKVSLKGQVEAAYDFTVYLSDVLRKKKYKFTQTVDDPSGAPSELWKIRAGKYQILKMQAQGKKGKNLTFKPSGRKHFIVRDQSLSNLGLWSVGGKSKKRIRIKRLSNSYEDKSSRSRSSIASGYTTVGLGGS